MAAMNRRGGCQTVSQQFVIIREQGRQCRGCLFKEPYADAEP